MVMKMHNIAAVLGLLVSFANASKVDVVLAHYNEDLSWVTRIPDNVSVHIYTKGSKVDLDVPSVSRASVRQLPNVGREAHTYLTHIVKNFERLADWTVFTQAGEPSFGYKGHRSGGGHLLAGDDFANYLAPHPSGSRFVYTAVVHLPSMNHLLRASYCINDELLEGGGANTCPKNASHWTSWWDMGEFRSFVSSKVESQHGDNIMDFYRKHINPAFSGTEVVAFFPQGARFAVSKETIQRRPKAEYERLLAILADDEDPYAGYFMEWLWSELFLGRQEPCPVPPMLTTVSHTEAMNNLVQRFPSSVQRQLSIARSLAGTADCVCANISGGAGISGSVSGSISSGISGSTISGGISGGISGSISGAISGGISSSISGVISGGISGAGCTCAGDSDGVSTIVSGGTSGGVAGDISGGVSGGISGGLSTTTAMVSSTTKSTTSDVTSQSSSVTSTGPSTSGFLSTSSSASTVVKSTTPVPSSTSSMISTTSSPVKVNDVSTNLTNVINVTNMTNVTRVAGVFEVEIYVQSNMSKEAVEDMFTRAIAAALEVPVELVVSVTASELEQGSGNQRRLQDNTTNQTGFDNNQTKLYEVAYEIIVPDSMDVNEIIDKANRIAEAGSAESQLFRQTLLSTNGVVGVGKIVSKVPASKKLPVEDVLPSTEAEDEDDTTNWTAVLVGACAFVLLVSCMVTTFVLIRRKMAATGTTKNAAHQEFHGIP